MTAIDGIGLSLAGGFWRLGFAHPREPVGMSAQRLARRIEDALGREVDASYMRALEAALIFVDHDSLHEDPRIEVREPDEEPR